MNQMKQLVSALPFFLIFTVMAQNGSSPDEEEKVLQKKLESIQREKRKLLLKNKIQEESQELERLGEGEKPESPKRGTLFSWPPESRWRWALGFSMQTGRGLSQSTLRFQNELYSISDSELEGTESGLGFPEFDSKFLRIL